nr:peroxidase 7 [Ipomoea batatas]
MKQFWRMILVISLQVLAIEGSHQRPAAATPAHATLNNALSFDYYMNSCPQLEQIVHNKIMQWIKRDRTLAPALIRLHFHDCAVRVGEILKTPSTHILLFQVQPKSNYWDTLSMSAKLFNAQYASGLTWSALVGLLSQSLCSYT